MTFIQNMQQFQANSQKNDENSKGNNIKESPIKTNNKKKSKKKQEKSENIVVDRETYKRSRSAIKKILDKYTEEKLLDTSSASSHSDREDKRSDHRSEKNQSDKDSDKRSDASGSEASPKRSRRSSASNSRKNSDASDESAPAHPKKPKGKQKPKISDSEGSAKSQSEAEEPQKSEHDSEEDEMFKGTPEEKLERQISDKDEEIERVQKEIEKLRKYTSTSVTEETMLKEKCQQYDPIIKELVDKNLLGSAKIETLFGKVRKSREKIDQVLNDLLIYQKEFETIQISKKSKPLKLKISRKIMETRLDCYKNYLLHLQSVIEDLERQIREFKRREKDYKKQAKIAGVGIAQKHNTYADQLKQKILMLETQIKKDLKEDVVNNDKKKKKIKAKGPLDKRDSKSTVKTQNVVKDLK